jgi:predicted RNase H-like HicB family nuclease
LYKDLTSKFLINFVFSPALAAQAQVWRALRLKSTCDFVWKFTLELEMKLTVSLDRDEDGVWIVECPSIPGCVSQGATKEEALENIKEAIQLCLEVRAEQGLPLTIETRQVDV